MRNWLASLGRQLLAAFGIRRRGRPFAWGVTLHDIDPSEYPRFRRIYAEQLAAVEAIDPSAIRHRDPEGCRWAVYDDDVFPAPVSPKAWGVYFAKSRIIVLKRYFVGRDDLLAHEIRHDILGTEDHPERFFHGSSLEMP